MDVLVFKLCGAFFQGGVSIFEACKGLVNDIMSSHLIYSCVGWISMNVTLTTTRPMIVKGMPFIHRLDNVSQKYIKASLQFQHKQLCKNYKDVKTINEVVIEEDILGLSI